MDFNLSLKAYSRRGNAFKFIGIKAPPECLLCHHYRFAAPPFIYTRSHPLHSRTINALLNNA